MRFCVKTSANILLFLLNTKIHKYSYRRIEVPLTERDVLTLPFNNVTNGLVTEMQWVHLYVTCYKTDIITEENGFTSAIVAE